MPQQLIEQLNHYSNFVAVTMCIVSMIHILFYVFMLFLYEKLVMRFTQKEIPKDVNYSLRIKYYHGIYWIIVFIFSVRWLVR